MDSSSITRGSLFVGATALNAFSQRVQATAYNIANVSTNGFEPVSLQLADGPGGYGVKPHSLTRAGQPVTASVSADRQVDQDSIPSATALEREIPQMITDQRAFQANVQIIRTADDLCGYVLDMKA